MKRIYTYILLIACTMVFASCQKDFDGVLTATLQDYRSDSKVHLNSQRYACWDNGDKVSINGDKSCSVVFNNTANPTEATININKQESEYRAVYPASYDGGTNVINLPQNQKYNEKDGKQVIEAPMVAYTTNSILSFYNLCSLIKVTFPTDAEVMNVVITELNGQKLWGKLSYSQNENANPSVSTISNEDNIKNIVTMDIPETYRQSLKGKSVYITIPPTLDAKLSIKLYYKRMSDNKNCKGERSMNRTCDFETSKLYNISMSSGVTVTNLGSGTKGDPYLISSAEEFRRLVEENPSSYFKQTSDFDLGSQYISISDFTGDYDGGENRITIGSQDSPNSKGGVFNTIGDGASIYDLKVSLYTKVESSADLGGIVNTCNIGSGTASIKNCRIENSIFNPEDINMGNYIIVGGICGCVSSGTLNIEKCVIKKEVTSRGRIVGGVVGMNKGGVLNITNCADYGSHTGGRTVGGIVGQLRTSGKLIIKNSYSVGNVYGGGNTCENRNGGIVGSNLINQSNMILTNVYFGGTVDRIDMDGISGTDGLGASSTSRANRIIGSGGGIVSYVYSPSEHNNGCAVTKYGIDDNPWKLSDGRTLVEALNANSGSNESWKGTGQPKLNFEP